MAAPAFRSLTTVTDATAANITGTDPAGAAENDILRADLYLESDTAVTPPAGWSNDFAGVPALAESNTASQEFRHYAYWIRRGASAPALTWTHASAYRGITIQAFSGAVTTEDPWSFLDNNVRDDTTAETYPDASGTTDTDDELLTWGGRFYTASSNGNTPPTGFAERQDGTGTAALLADNAQAAAGATGTVTGALFDTAANHPASSIMAGLKSVAAPPALADAIPSSFAKFPKVKLRYAD